MLFEIGRRLQDVCCDDQRHGRGGLVALAHFLAHAFWRRKCLDHLEGIDPINNPSVYQFKRRLGGEEVTLHGHKHFPVSCIGRIASAGIIATLIMFSPKNIASGSNLTLGALV